MTVPGFPNLFMLYGPGTNGGELVSMLEAQAEYAVRAMKRMARRRGACIEVKPRFEAPWNLWLQSKMLGTSWTMSNNYFRAPTGKIVTQWPSGNLVYRAAHKVPGQRVGGHSTSRPWSLMGRLLVPMQWFSEWLPLLSARCGGSACSRCQHSPVGD